MATIEDLRWKIQRATDHLEDFKSNYLGRSGPVYPPHAAGIKFEPNWKHILITADALHPVQQRWLGILIGEVIHQLRKSLDHLIYALATRGCQRPTNDQLKDLEFLIRKSSHDFKCDWRVTKSFFEKLIGDRELAQMEASQPYHRNTIAPTSDPLWILRELDNVDKHRTVVVMGNQTTVVGTAYSKDEVYTQPFKFTIATEPTKPNTESFDLSWSFPDPPATVNMDNATRHIVFTETSGLCDGMEVFELTRRTIKLVDDTLVTFSRFF